MNNHFQQQTLDYTCTSGSACVCVYDVTRKANDIVYCCGKAHALRIPSGFVLAMARTRTHRHNRVWKCAVWCGAVSYLPVDLHMDSVMSIQSFESERGEIPCILYCIVNILYIVLEESSRSNPEHTISHKILFLVTILVAHVVRLKYVCCVVCAACGLLFSSKSLVQISYCEKLKLLGKYFGSCYFCYKKDNSIDDEWGFSWRDYKMVE